MYRLVPYLLLLSNEHYRAAGLPAIAFFSNGVPKSDGLLDAILAAGSSRHKRSDQEILHLRDNYPSSPVSAFFGHGGTAHTFGHYTQVFKIPSMYGSHTDMNMPDGKPLNILNAGYDVSSDSRSRISNGETITSNNYPEVNWGQAYDRYTQLLDANAKKPLPAAEYTPVAFFGRTPFQNDFNYGGNINPGFTRHHVDMDAPNGDNPSGRLGLRIHYRSSNSQPMWNYAHTINGVNDYPATNWQELFNNYMAKHQQNVPNPRFT